MVVQLATRIGDVRRKSYISPCGKTKISADYFAVPKVVLDGVLVDVRVVYNATKSSLNLKAWAPNFWMHSVDTPLCSLSYRYWVVDFDLGEFFINFPLPPVLRKFVWVQMDAIKRELNNDSSTPCVYNYESWCQYLMGYTGSPFCTMKSYYHAEEVVIQNHKNQVARYVGMWLFSIVLGIPSLTLISHLFINGIMNDSVLLESLEPSEMIGMDPLKMLNVVGR